MRSQWFGRVALLWLALGLALSVSVATVRATDKLTAEQALKKQVFLLKMENAQLKARLTDREQRVAALETVFRLQVEGQFQKDSQALSDECKALEADFRKTLKPADTTKFDCTTLEFK